MHFSFKKKMITLNLVAIFFVFIDRLLKTLALGWGSAKTPLIGRWLAFGLTENKNIAFSLPITGVGLNILIFLILVLILVMIIKKWRQGDPSASLLFFIFLGGASNLYDRLKCGYVIDYFDFAYFSVFNLADALITLGILALIFIGRNKPKEFSQPE